MTDTHDGQFSLCCLQAVVEVNVLKLEDRSNKSLQLVHSAMGAANLLKLFSLELFNFIFLFDGLLA